jgi:C4-dicarboxylate-specific signal transduction histidine kinase
LLAIIFGETACTEKKPTPFYLIRKEELELTLKTLKSTQAQLIQQKKWLLLGSSLSGIAHEIQNPLNFVKNFSEVNGELVEN